MAARRMHIRAAVFLRADLCVSAGIVGIDQPERHGFSVRIAVPADAVEGAVLGRGAPVPPEFLRRYGIRDPRDQKLHFVRLSDMENRVVFVIQGVVPFRFLRFYGRDHVRCLVRASGREQQDRRRQEYKDSLHGIASVSESSLICAPPARSTRGTGLSPRIFPES